MKILFVCNGNIERENFITAPWIEGLIIDLEKKDKIKLSIAFPSFLNKRVEVSEINNISYFSYPSKTQNPIKYDIKTERYLREILVSEIPDIVHVFGTEFPLCLTTANVCNGLGITDKMVISIAGVISVIYKHYYNGLACKTINSFTLRDLLKLDNIKLQANKFRRRGVNEIAALQEAKHVIGRTTFDKACILQINPDLEYYFCNETLRQVFYNNCWDINCCEKHSIFISQSDYPVKGFHYILEAMPEILKRFPDAHLYTTGNDIIDLTSFEQKLKESSYQRYLRKLIKKYKLEKHVTFLGQLSAEQMCDRYLKSNVFVCSSTIENSPNSLGEAMILGVPCVAAAVGGVTDMLQHKEEGFVYQSDAPYMLAHYICEVFKNKEQTLNFSKKAKEHASKTHNKAKNMNDLLDIYTKIICEGK